MRDGGLEGAEEVEDCHEDEKAGQGFWQILLVLFYPVLYQPVALNSQKGYPDNRRTDGEGVGQHECNAVDSPQAEGKERKLLLVDESQEERKDRHVPEGLRRLPLMVMGVVVIVGMRVIMMVVVMRMVMRVGRAVCPIGNVEQQYDYPVPNTGERSEIDGLVD